MTGPRLTESQIEELKKEAVTDGVGVRFLYKGQALGIQSGQLYPKGSNVIYHPIYFKFTKETAKKIARWLDARPVFYEDK